MDWQPFILTFKLAAVTTLILLVVGIPVANWLAFSRNRFKVVIEAIVSLPLILPPTVLGFYLLLAFGKDNWLGAWLDDLFGVQVLFSFGGLVVASVIYSLPFMVQPIQSGFAQVDKALIDASAVLGKSRFTTLNRVIIPNARPAIISGIILTFAHTIGEFGVVLMVGGNIPGVTNVASIAIFDEVQVLNYRAAHIYSAVLLALSFGILIVVHLANGGNLKITSNGNR